MKKNIYLLILPLAVLSGLVFSFAPFDFGLGANCEMKNETKPSSKPLSVADRNANLDARKKWEASPDGIKYKEWEVSPEGKKVYASYDKIKKSIKTFSNMEAVVTSLTFQRDNAKSTGLKWIIVRINGEEYMMQFIPTDFKAIK